MSRLFNYLRRVGCNVVCVFAVLSVFAVQVHAQDVTFYTDETLWRNAVGDIELFATNASNIVKADEVTALPGDDTYLSSTLTFNRSNTGLSRSFSTSTLQSGASFVFNGWPSTAHTNALSVGGSTTNTRYEDDDWQLNVTGGVPLRAFAFNLGDNDYNVGESLSVYDAQMSLLGSTTAIPALPGAFGFMGIVSESPVSVIRFNEAVDGDHISIADFRFGVPSNPPAPDPGTFPDPLPPSDANNVVFMVHGWKDSSALFTTDDANDLGNTNMAANIQQNLVAHGKTDWDVRTYDWSEDAALGFLEPDIAPTSRCKATAQAHGQDLAKQIIGQYETDADVHLIAHSLGGRVIDEAARVLEQADWNGTVHLTFLDAYTPDGWEDSFGETATWAEHYYDVDLAVNTQADLNYAHNVDITELLDPRGSTSDNHKWPVRWYDSTIGQENGYGFPLSMENLDPSGVWTSPALYLPPADSLAISNQQYVNPVDETINTSPTGTIDATSTQLTLGTGSPVWINIDMTTDDVTNFLEFVFEFTEDADGLLSVYLDDELLGLFYERFALDGQQDSGKLFFEDDLEAGFHVLAFRVDPLTDDASFVTLSGIEVGYMTVVPEPSTFVLLAMGAFGLLVRAYRKRR